MHYFCDKAFIDYQIPANRTISNFAIGHFHISLSLQKFRANLTCRLIKFRTNELAFQITTKLLPHESIGPVSEEPGIMVWYTYVDKIEFLCQQTRIITLSTRERRTSHPWPRQTAVASIRSPTREEIANFSCSSFSFVQQSSEPRRSKMRLDGNIGLLITFLSYYFILNIATALPVSNLTCKYPVFCVSRPAYLSLK